MKKRLQLITIITGLIIMALVIGWLIVSVQLLKQQTTLHRYLRVGGDFHSVENIKKPDRIVNAADTADWASYGLDHPGPSGRLAEYRFFGGTYCYVSLDASGTIIDFSWYDT